MDQKNTIYYLYYSDGIFSDAPRNLLKEIIEIMEDVPLISINSNEERNTLERGYEILSVGFKNNTNKLEFIVWGKDISSIENTLWSDLFPAFSNLIHYIADKRHDHSRSIQDLVDTMPNQVFSPNQTVRFLADELFLSQKPKIYLYILRKYHVSLSRFN